MTPYAHWTADSGTTELSYSRRGIPLEDQHTAEIPFWIPSVPTLVTREPLFPRLRKALGVVAVVAGCLALSAVPSTPMDSPAVVVAP